MPKAKEHVVKFTKKKETPGTVVFTEVEEDGKPPVIGSLYVKKYIAGKAEEVTVTLSVPQ